MKVCVMGLGYIGLPTSIMFARHGAEVVGVDVKKDVVTKLNSGEIHIEEPGLREALLEVIEKGMFKASLKPEKADAFIISVPTPNLRDPHQSCDLTYVLDALNRILPCMEKGNTVIVESTISPRSMDDHIKPVIEAAGFVVGRDLFLVHCPERVLPGQIMHELIYNNRIIGGITPDCTEAGVRVYSIFVQGEMIRTNAKTAEMSKLMENTFRDVNIALANELTKVCDQLEINALDVIQMANKHPRVNLHHPGPGVGGHCLAVDPYFIVSKAPETAKIIQMARSVNTSMPAFVVENINALMQKVDGKIITLFGLTYKGNVDDMRKSPAMEVLERLKFEGRYGVKAYDPHVNSRLVTKDIREAAADSDLIVVLTDHDEFKELDFSQLSGMATKRMFDTKNVVQNRSEVFQYINFGNLYHFKKQTMVGTR
ncbi:nucleotide sugar dehydrogenase [Bacillus norwichensis]|uniref:Nucleotide sugar dehydrogenase n=1 Tax=Bacillus norwichensis TaxID=2762217 RepID=A0ABR8VKV6_9BACI|nr:nucleotide sugar dehydrogenase [Bacillus norwichensis]MBD8005399.1 nucleotide sugar dehydrogenase [Bacillus norwichensis]